VKALGLHSTGDVRLHEEPEPTHTRRSPRSSAGGGLEIVSEMKADTEERPR
jgi:hypothetical protein